MQQVRTAVSYISEPCVSVLRSRKIQLLQIVQNWLAGLSINPSKDTTPADTQMWWIVILDRNCRIVLSQATSHQAYDNSLRVRQSVGFCGGGL